MSHNIGASLGLEPGSWQEAIYDIFVGTVVGGAHIFYFVKKWCLNFLWNPIVGIVQYLRNRITTTTTKSTVDNDDGGNNNLQQQHDTNNNNSTETTTKKNGELKVIGAGFGRTGTYSLTLALEELGFPTLHTQHLYENEEIFQMWTDRIFQPSLDKGTAELGIPDFHSITSKGYEATTDFPMALYVNQIQDVYPNCKFILTTRENSEVWFRSWDTLTKSITAPTHFGGYFITGVRQYSIYLRWLFAIVNQDDSFLTSSRPKMTQYKEAAIESYERHNQNIRTTVPSSQLLEYNVKQGWEPLCTFLDIDPSKCPTHPFPKTNSARSVQVQAVSAAATPLFLVLLVVFFFFTVVFQRITGSKTVLGWVQQRITQIIPRMIRRVLFMDKEQQQYQVQQPQKASQAQVDAAMKKGTKNKEL